MPNLIRSYTYLYRTGAENISKENTDIIKFAECLLRLFTILELVDTVYSSKNFKIFLLNENPKVLGDTSIETIKADFDKHIEKEWTIEDIRQFIVEYNKNTLVYLNEYLYAKEKGLPFNFSDDPKNVEVEHILPKSGKDIESKRIEAGISPEDFVFIANQLGNKIVLEGKINKAISNESFISKKHNSNKKSYCDSQYNLAKALSEYPNNNWTKDDIERATGKVAERIIKFIFP